VHGPGVDDPLVGLSPLGGGSTKYVYITDGRGRLVAFTDTLARNVMNEPPYQNGGNQAGAVTKATTFANSRAETPDAAGVSFYRNRYYDQNTSRWTQEDPIGIAGGVNLYSYVGNNPAIFTDPFGLRICFLGNPEQVQELKAGTEEATNTIIVLDRKNCVVKWEARGREGFEEIQSRFAEMADPRTTVFKVRFAGKGQGSRFLPETNTARVRRGDIGFPYRAGIGAACPSTGRFTLGAIIVHELIGHGYQVLTTGRPADQPEAIRIENLYHSARDQLTRCGGGI
jgi:RHS repeat-associated protein